MTKKFIGGSLGSIEYIPIHFSLPLKASGFDKVANKIYGYGLSSK
jgi:hypothetical protein